MLRGALAKQLKVLLPFMTLASAIPSVAAADAPTWSVGPTAVIPHVAPASLVLPKGIHLGSNGRYYQDLCDHDQPRFCLTEKLLPEAFDPTTPVSFQPEVTPSGMKPSDIVAAYDIPSGSAAHGKIVAILDSPDSNAYGDLSTYRSTFGLPALPRCNGMPTGTTPCFAQVAEDGSASSGQDSGANADGETGLDMDMISAACPDCSILLVEITQLGDTDFLAGVKTAASLGAVATSISIGGPESNDPNQRCGGGGSDPTGYTTPGHLVLAASGDFGYLEENTQCKSPSYPSSAPDVLAVGGTTLTGGSYSETAWNDGQGGQDATTSGCSTEFPMPAWQSSLLSGTGCSNRATADISAAAAFNNASGQPVAIASYSSGQWQPVEGTSASSPLVAAILTRLGLTDQVSASFGFLYQNIAAFHDVTTGADGSGSTCTNKLCKSGAGWDGPTGVGTPNGTALAALTGSGCASNAQCSAPTAVCLTASGRCVGCAANSDCSGTTPTCDTTSNQCKACGTDADCPGAHCAPTGQCVACNTNADCTPSEPVCEPSNHTCGGGSSSGSDGGPGFPSGDSGAPGYGNDAGLVGSNNGSNNGSGSFLPGTNGDMSSPSSETSGSSGCAISAGEGARASAFGAAGWIVGLWMIVRRRRRAARS